MTKITYPLAAFAALILLSGCGAPDTNLSYIGQIEAETVTVSSRTSGELLSLAADEGATVTKGEVLGTVDTESLEIQRREQQAGFEELAARKRSAQLQIDQAETQLDLARETLQKTEKLLSSGGATQQRRDELATQVDVGQANLEILRANLQSIVAQEDKLKAGIDLINLSIQHGTVTSPATGVILNRFRNPGELLTMGTPLVEIADLSVLDVYIYVPLSELPRVTLGQTVSVTVTGSGKSYDGTVSWVSDEGEFTPKTILTRDTRDTLVYEVRIRVPNPNGELKIGMPADVVL